MVDTGRLIGDYWFDNVIIPSQLIELLTNVKNSSGSDAGDNTDDDDQIEHERLVDFIFSGDDSWISNSYVFV